MFRLFHKPLKMMILFCHSARAGDDVQAGLLAGNGMFRWGSRLKPLLQQQKRSRFIFPGLISAGRVVRPALIVA